MGAQRVACPGPAVVAKPRCAVFRNLRKILEKQETWKAGKDSGWDHELLSRHAFRLFDVMTSTKEVLEDTFGYLSRRNAVDSRNPVQMSVERAYFLASLSPRWQDEAWPRVHVQPGDLQNQQAIRHARGREAYLPRSNTRKTTTFADLKKVVDAGANEFQFWFVWLPSASTPLVA